MIHVIAVVDTVEGARGDFLAEFHKVLPFVRAEEGCIEYGPVIDLETDFAVPARVDVVTILEKWEDLRHLKEHLKAPHMMEYRKRVKDLVKGMKVYVMRSA
jgi:quinol monooxygenase YgiN